ncbi:hypothetical protein [Pyxidicoccus sp. MSG2]|uniref:hypothetical protein n=1 Tax=Pyxidicoccus sp. MSG2 TaxID=2996790 RepID=UPI0022714C70|nr:hypothetical protein [Pyxidicoccus sp. MSG2]MCY1020718.1 hypothetical protein [Pyxidicoccus sp. MSG2]
MKMKHSVISALLALGMSACVESTPSLQIGSASAQAEDCTISTTTTGPGLLRGTVNLGFEGVGGYPLVLAVTSNLQSIPIQVGEQPVGSDVDLNTIYITELALSYSSPTEGLRFTESSSSVPIYGTLSDKGSLLINLFTAETFLDLVGFVVPGKSAEVLVTVQLKGERASGDELDSNEIVFPITVYNIPEDDLATSLCGTGGKFEAPTEACDQRGLNGVVPACQPAAP